MQKGSCYRHISCTRVFEEKFSEFYSYIVGFSFKLNRIKNATATVPVSPFTRHRCKRQSWHCAKCKTKFPSKFRVCFVGVFTLRPTSLAAEIFNNIFHSVSRLSLVANLKFSLCLALFHRKIYTGKSCDDNENRIKREGKKEIKLNKTTTFSSHLHGEGEWSKTNNFPQSIFLSSIQFAISIFFLFQHYDIRFPWFRLQDTTSWEKEKKN